jgi:hypothetical protein
MRPEFHFTAEQGWINDPHGITVRDGVYHAFYQYVPGQHGVVSQLSLGSRLRPGPHVPQGAARGDRSR